MYNPIYIYNLFFLNAQLNHFYFINYYLKKKKLLMVLNPNIVFKCLYS